MNKTILYGAFGRYNFGDILFPHVIEQLLIKNNLDNDIEYCDILARDMSKHGGHRVKSIVDFLDHPDLINVVHVGGETCGCPIQYAIKMFDPDNNEPKISKFKKLSEPAYILSKSDFINPNKFIFNSGGGFSIPALLKFINYDYLSFRDHLSFEKSVKNKLENSIHCVDSAILTKRFFNKTITDRNDTTYIKDLQKSLGANYIAIQMSKKFCINNKNFIIKSLSDIISLNHLPIVFFAAGTSPNHDEFNIYSELSEHLPKNMFHICESENCWDVCNIISNARFVLGTSLHVRILSMQYFRPRATLSPSDKHSAFIIDWDNIKNISVDLQNVAKYISKSLWNHNIDLDIEHLEFLEKDYLYKSNWINLLQ